MCPPDPTPASPLIARLRAGDERAFAEAFDHYADLVARLAARYTGSDDTAADILQDIFVRLWERRAQLPDDLNLKAYLLRAARNAALDLADHNKVVDAWAANIRLGWGGPEPGVGQSGEWLIEREDLTRLVEQTLFSLPPRIRETFLLHRDQELRPREIADLLGVTPETVYVNLSRALKAMTQALETWKKQ